ncbi:15745_t:CDS:2 [Cetraspora pellucida]|uniref:15745_t:CDS:1 n=1 Tax=Cetraspora pellucida TaxID=1433469 RepID=A0ACA9ME17_9GLOM|nr:15745_t:CDS:2 [Cetraspora pellucida]
MADNRNNNLEVVKDTFHNCLEAFEEYIGKLNIPDFKRQIYHRTIADSNYTLEGFEDVFLNQLLMVAVSTFKKTAEFRQEIQKEKIGGGVWGRLSHPRELPEVNITGQAEVGKEKLEKITNLLAATDRTNFHFYQGDNRGNNGPATSDTQKNNDLSAKLK